MALSFGQNLFAGGVFGNPKQLGVFGQSGMDVGILGQELDFEFGDIVVLNNPDDQVLQKFEGNFFFGHTFKDAILNTSIWTGRLDDGTGTYSIVNDHLVLNSPGAGDNVRVGHVFTGRQFLTGDMTFEARVKANNDGGSVQCAVGMTGATAGTGFFAASDGAWFEINTDENTWRPVTKNAAKTNGATFTIPNNTWVRFKIIVTTNTVKFYVNDTLQQTITGANVPDDSTLRMIFQADEGGGDASNLRVEWCKVEWGF